MQHHVPILFDNIPEETLRWGKKIIAVEQIRVIAEGESVNRFYNCISKCFV
jgi:hypothetical protein